MGKARSFSNEANEIVYQTESNNENFALGSQQNSYNLGSVHFSDQSGIGNFSQSGQNSKFVNLKGSTIQGNFGFVQQTVLLDVGTSTINLNNDSTGTALAVISQDRIVSLSAGTTSDLTTITGAQRPGQRVTLYNIFSNTITIKNDAGATVNKIVTPGAVDFSLSGHGVVTLVFDISLAQWRIDGNLGSGGGGVSFPIIPPVLVLGNVNTNQNIDLSLTTAHSTTLTLTDSIDITFSNFPTTGNQISWEVQVTQDSTGGHVITWPAEVTNPPTLPTAANSITVVVFRVLDGGTSVRVGNTVTTTGGTGDTSLWATFNAVQDINFATFDGINIDRLLFDQAAGSPLAASSTGITSNANSDLLFNVPAVKFHTFSSGGTDILQIDDTTGLKILGTHVINLNKQIMNTIGSLQFDNTVVFNPTTVYTIGFDDGTNQLIHNVALVTDAHSFKAAGELLATITRFGANSGLLTIDNIVAGELLQIDEELDFLDSTADPTTPGEMRRNGADVKVVSGGLVRNFSDITAVAPNSISEGDSNITVTDVGSGLIVTTIDGTNRFQIQATRADYQDMDVFGINRLSLRDEAGATERAAFVAGTSDVRMIFDGASDKFFININSVDTATFEPLRLVLNSGLANTLSAALRLFRDDASPLANDALGTIHFDGNDSGGAFTNYVTLIGSILDPTAGSEDGAFTINMLQAGVEVRALRLESGVFEINKTSTAGGDLAEINLIKVDASPGTGSSVGEVNFVVDDSGVETEYASIQTLISDVTDAGLFKIKVRSDNTLQDALIIEGNDNSTQFQFITSSNGNTRIQPGSGELLGYFVTPQVEDFSLNLGTSGSLEIPQFSDGSPSVTDLNSAFGAFDGAIGQDISDGKLYVRKSSTVWSFYSESGTVT